MNSPSLDDARAAFPHLGLALYAFEPGGPVTLEVHAGEQVFRFKGVSVGAVMRRAFPSLNTPPPPPTPPEIVPETVPEEPLPTPPPPNVFD